MIIPQNYVIQKFLAYTRRGIYNSSSNSYNAECASCLEGKSRGKKRRFYYFPQEEFLICYNCGRAWKPLQWVMEICNLTFNQVKDEIDEGDFNDAKSFLQDSKRYERKLNPYTLPQDCINLFDPHQIKFYKSNKVIKDALDFIKSRRLDTAINRPDKLWISLKDFIHKNRIIIPFQDPDHKTRFYQSRAIYEKDINIAKYLSKLNSEKTIYGLDKISSDLNHIIFTEGPIDAFFIPNGLGICGLKLSEHQQLLLAKYSLYKRIWVLDNDLHTNKNVKDQYKQLIKRGETVFVWPKNKGKIKDVNELCIGLKLDKIKQDFFINNSYHGIEALSKISL